jgi:hypothetical protein
MADVTASLLAAGFVETVFHCPTCGLAGMSLSRPAALAERSCVRCDELVVSSLVVAA